MKLARDNLPPNYSNTPVRATLLTPVRYVGPRGVRLERSRQIGMGRDFFECKPGHIHPDKRGVLCLLVFLLCCHTVIANKGWIRPPDTLQLSEARGPGPSYLVRVCYGKEK